MKSAGNGGIYVQVTSGKLRENVGCVPEVDTQIGTPTLPGPRRPDRPSRQQSTMRVGWRGADAHLNAVPQQRLVRAASV